MKITKLMSVFRRRRRRRNAAADYYCNKNKNKIMKKKCNNNNNYLDADVDESEGALAYSGRCVLRTTLCPFIVYGSLRRQVRDMLLFFIIFVISRGLIIKNLLRRPDFPS